MQAHEAFKLGFLARCVEAGLTPEQTCELAKRAADCLTKQAFDWTRLNPLPPLLNTGAAVLNFGEASAPYLAAAAAIPPSLGAAAAYLVNSATDVDDDAAVADVKKQELIDNYQRMAEQLARRKQSQQYSKQRKRTGRVFL